MEKILTDLGSGEWWFSVVCVAVIVCVLGTYASRSLDAIWLRFVKFFSARTRASREHTERMIAFYTRNQPLIPIYVGQVQIRALGVIAAIIMAGIALTAVTVCQYAGHFSSALDERIVLPALNIVTGMLLGTALRHMPSVLRDMAVLSELKKRLSTT